MKLLGSVLLATQLVITPVFADLVTPQQQEQQEAQAAQQKPGDPPAADDLTKYHNWSTTYRGKVIGVGFVCFNKKYADLVIHTLQSNHGLSEGDEKEKAETEEGHFTNSEVMEFLIVQRYCTYVPDDLGVKAVLLEKLGETENYEEWVGAMSLSDGTAEPMYVIQAKNSQSI